MTPDTTPTRRLIDEALGLEQLPAAPARVVTDLFRDGLAVLLAGMNHPTVQTLVRHVRALGCTPRSPLYGADLATAPHEAALVHGTAMHVLDFEPMFLPPTHAVSPVLGALLSLAHAEPMDGDGQRLACAMAAGVQLQADLRRAAQQADSATGATKRHFPFQRHGFHPPGTVGPMGSALAASLWLQLTPHQVACALGLAASRCSGLSANIGTMTKATHCGNAARIGVESALLARQGFSASSAIFEAPGGWVETFGGPSFEVETLIEGMQSLRCFTDPGFAFKRWPAHTAMQVAIEAGLAFRSDDPPPTSLTIYAPVFRYCDRPSPADSDAARFSFQYNVAVAILDGEVGFETYTEERLRRPDVQQMMERTTLVLDPSIPPVFDGMKVTVTTANGRAASADRWKGHWREPAEESELRAKFQSCARRLLPDSQTDALHQAVLDLSQPGGLPALLSLLAALPSYQSA